MAVSLPSLVTRLRAGRVRILWLVLGALLLVSALPIGLYHRQVLELSQEKLVDTERVQQTELTRSLAQEVQFFESNLTQQLISQRQILALTRPLSPKSRVCSKISWIRIATRLST